MIDADSECASHDIRDQGFSSDVVSSAPVTMLSKYLNVSQLFDRRIHAWNSFSDVAATSKRRAISFYYLHIINEYAYDVECNMPTVYSNMYTVYSIYWSL